MKRLLATLVLAMTTLCGAAQAAEPAPRLIVAISVDQFSAGLFEAWRGRFNGGVARLSQGIVYSNGFQAHAATETCPGHSTLLSGRHPNKTGIVGNTMRDPATGKDVYCLSDPTVVLAHGAGAPVGPGRMMVDTLGDWLKAASPQSRVVSVSGKDRGAITMAGHRPDGVFWAAEGFGFTTYLAPGADATKALAPVAELNARLASVWTKRPSWPAAADCRRLQSSWTLDGKPWPSRTPPPGFGQSDDRNTIGREVMTSPTLDDLTLEAARHLVRHYRLGRGPAVDMLTVSFSATDLIGHRYGSQGPEMCDQLRRLDANIGRLLADLDGVRVPYLVVLSADHGGSDFVERLNAEGYAQARRVDGRSILARVNQQLVAELGLKAPPLGGSVEDVVLADSVPAADRARTAAAAVRVLAAQPEIAAAFTVEELQAVKVPREKPADELTLRERFALSAYPGRSADILVALQPYTTAARAAPGSYLAGHGSIWNYDRRVPILFWWPNAPGRTRSLPIMTVDIAPTLASVVGVTPPADIDGRCLPLADFGHGLCGGSGPAAPTSAVP